MLPWSVMAHAPIPCAFTRGISSRILLAPSSSENCVWRCRWTNDIAAASSTGPVRLVGEAHGSARPRGWSTARGLCEVLSRPWPPGLGPKAPTNLSRSIHFVLDVGPPSVRQPRARPSPRASDRRTTTQMIRRMLALVTLLPALALGADIPLSRDPHSYFALALRQARLKNIALPEPGCNLGINCAGPGA